jgi:hypothetical protein
MGQREVHNISNLFTYEIQHMGKIGSEDAFFEAQSQDLPAIDFFSHHI